MLVALMAAAVLAAAGTISGGPSDMAWIPAGPFHMGDATGSGWPQEKPRREIRVSGFYIDRREVANAEVRDVLQWAYDRGLVTVDARSVRNREGQPRVLLELADWNCEIRFADGAFSVEPGRERFPCVEVTWYGALAFCNFRSDREGLARALNFADWECDFESPGYRLPTEAEWEKAARGGVDGHEFPWPGKGGDFAQHVDGGMANYWNSGDPFETASFPAKTSPVGYYDGAQTPPGGVMTNGYGLFDMAGNVWEWCWDWYDPLWYARPETSRPDPTGPAHGTERVRRGGSWINGQKEMERGLSGGALARSLRCAMRAGGDPARGTWNWGFRCVRRPERSETP